MEQAFSTVQKLTVRELIDFVHALPEWKNPGKSAVRIDPMEILSHAKLDGDELKLIEAELQSAQTAKVALQAA